MSSTAESRAAKVRPSVPLRTTVYDALPTLAAMHDVNRNYAIYEKRYLGGV